jgi:hypothetical protein
MLSAVYLHATAAWIRLADDRPTVTGNSFINVTLLRCVYVDRDASKMSREEPQKS